MDFDQWLYEACEYISMKTGKNIHDIYQMINLTDAKLSFIDGIDPVEYKPFIKN